MCYNDKKEVLMTNHITKLIENSGKKLTEISEATNIAYPTLSGYNQGIRKPKKDNAEKLAYSVLSLPVHTELTTEQQDLVIDSIKDFFK